jgi:hypothetical protein
VLPENSWVAARLAKGFLALQGGASLDAAIDASYARGSFSRAKIGELLNKAQNSGFKKVLDARNKIGSAENPITKLFPAAITEERFSDLLKVLVEKARLAGRALAIEDKRADHSFVDFTIHESAQRLPINIKNAGTLFRRSAEFVGLAPEDCIPIPAYKAFGALEKKEPNLVYVICVDHELVGVVREAIPSTFDANEKLVWALLESYVGHHVKKAEDTFVLGMVRKYWPLLASKIASKPFRLISARRAIKILQSLPKRTPGLGVPAWGTGASAEVNVHVSIAAETTSWEAVEQMIITSGTSRVLAAIDRRVTEEVPDPEI